MLKESCIKISNEDSSKNLGTVLCFLIKVDGKVDLYTIKSVLIKEDERSS